MLWIKSLHIIFMVMWFSGLFYLPRLFVYHSAAIDTISIERFKLMERRLYYYITTPGAIITIVFGFWLVSFNYQYYLMNTWLQIKIALVFLLVIYHILLGKWLNDFRKNNNQHSERFYRIINEIPTVFLFSIVLLTILKPLS